MDSELIWVTHNLGVSSTTWGSVFVKPDILFHTVQFVCVCGGGEAGRGGWCTMRTHTQNGEKKERKKDRQKERKKDREKKSVGHETDTTWGACDSTRRERRFEKEKKKKEEEKNQTRNASRVRDSQNSICAGES
jgi:hypothetical protein